MLLMLVLIAVAFGVDKYFKFKTKAWDDQHPFVPIAPHENADGTVDYTLVSKPLKSAVGKYSVLRFPKNVLVLPPHGELLADASFTNGDNPNGGLILHFKIPSFEPLRQTVGDERYLLDTFHVNVSPREFDSEFLNSKTISEAEKYCTKVSYIEPSVAVYVTKSPNTNSLLESCFLGDQKSDGGVGYLVYDSNKKLLAEIICSTQGANSTNKNNQTATCSGSLFAEQGNYVQFNWNSETFDPAQLQSLVSTLKSSINEATVRVEDVPPNQVYKP